jgi:histidyl-tRNA synthetase
MLARQSMIDTIRRVYELYGFVPLSTPAIEFLDVLSGSAGTEAQQSIFRVTNPENEALGLRFDLTVPLARVIAQYADLPRPFRRYQVAPVWRADAGQGDATRVHPVRPDSVGTVSGSPTPRSSPGCATRCRRSRSAATWSLFLSRAVLNLLLDFAGIGPEQGVDVFRVLDKLDKVGLDKISRELMNGYKDESGDTIRGVGLDGSQVDRIKRFLDIKSDSRREVAARLRELFATLDHAPAQIDVIERISNHLYALGSTTTASRSISIARGLAYYRPGLRNDPARRPAVQLDSAAAGTTAW